MFFSWLGFLVNMNPDPDRGMNIYCDPDNMRTIYSGKAPNPSAIS